MAVLEHYEGYDISQLASLLVGLCPALFFCYRSNSQCGKQNRLLTQLLCTHPVLSPKVHCHSLHSGVSCLILQLVMLHIYSSI